MNQRDKTVEIHLVGGSPTGIKHIKMTGWDGQVIVCPRTRLKELMTDWVDESKRSGVYLLSGEDEKSDKSRIYVGQAGKNILERLQFHSRQQGKRSFWKQAFIFTNKDRGDDLHVAYLEWSILEKARDAGRVEIDNDNEPTRPNLSRSKQSAMEDYLDNAQIILTTLGFPYLQRIITNQSPAFDQLRSSRPSAAVKSDAPDEISPEGFHRFRFSGKEFEGTGIRTDEGFVVLKGSTGKREPAESLNKKLKDMRDSKQRQKEIGIKGGRIFFNKHVIFSSPSAAASFLAGVMRSGQSVWKDENGRTLKQYEEELISSTEESISKDKKKPKPKASKVTDLPKAPEKKSQTDPKKNREVMQLFEAGSIKAGDKVWLMIKGKPSSKATLTKDGNCRFGKEIMSLNDYAKSVADAKTINIYKRIIHGPTGKLLRELSNQLK